MFSKKIKLILRSINNKISIKKYFRRKKLLDKSYLILHCPRSGGTYLKNIINFVYGNVIENNSLKKIDKSSINKFRPFFLIGHHIHTDFDEQIESKIKRYLLLRDPNQRVISRYFYLKNFIKLKKAKKIIPNIVIKNNLSLNEYIKIIKSSFNDNFLTRMLINKVNSNDFENETIKGKTVFNELNNTDFQKALANIKKYKILLTNNMDIENFLQNELLIDNLKYYHDKMGNSNFKNQSLRNSTDNIDISELNKINYYDNKLYDLFN